LPSEAIAALYEDAEGTLWIGTGGGGLSRWRQGRFENFSTRQRLPDDFILQILEDGEGALWLGSNNGLIRLPRRALADLAAGKTKYLAAMLYGKRDGLPTPQFSAEHSSLAVRSSDGALWFSLANGVVRVAPPQTGPPAPPPRILIETILANDRPLSAPYRVLAQTEASQTAAAEAGGPLLVPAGRNKLEFQYTAIDLTGPEKVRFRFMLEGLDSGWEDAGDRRVASYGHVRPGDYRFRVIGCNHEGAWNEEGAAVSLRVLPYAWETWWFRAGLGLALLGAVVAGVRRVSVRRLRRRIARLEQENRIQHERTRIAQDLHDDLGTSLTEIGFLGSLARSDAGGRPEVQTRLDAIVERASRMAKSLDQIVWAVNPANDTMSSTANYLCSRAQESLRAAGVRCRLDVAETFPPLAVNSEVRHNLLLAVNEAINNAMKHAAASELWLRIRARDSCLEIAVEDNGRGFSPESSNNHRNGLKNMRRRLEAIGGKFEVQSAPGQGTTVRFTLPFQGEAIN
jgi:signal transduction histidine kinase